MNEVTSIDTQNAEAVPQRKRGGMTAEEAAYMRGGKEPVAGSVPMSTSKFLNSPLFTHAWSTMSLRRFGDDVAITYDIPTMSRGLDDVADYHRLAMLITEEKEKNPTFAAWLDRRQMNDFSAEKLKPYAPGTLGATLYSFIVDSGMEINFINQYTPKTDVEYLMKRNGETHDIHHMATGFGPNMAGEHALAYMNVTAQHRFFSPELAGMISMPNNFVGAAMMSRVGFNYPQGMPIILEATRLGIEAGQKVKLPLFMVDWDAYLDWQLDDITRDLGFERGPGEGWANTADVTTG